MMIKRPASRNPKKRQGRPVQAYHRFRETGTGDKQIDAYRWRGIADFQIG